MITAICTKEENPWTEKKYEELKQGEEYEVKHIEMGSAMTWIFLKGKKTPFNSLCFQFRENGNPLNIYKDKRFNPYL